MSLQINKSQKRKETLFLVFGICLCLYFSFHFMFGERGYLKYVSLSHQYELSQIELDQVSSEKNRIEKKVIGMRADTMDMDLFEERVQLMLGVLPENAFILTN